LNGSIVIYDATDLFVAGKLRATLIYFHVAFLKGDLAIFAIFKILWGA